MIAELIFATTLSLSAGKPVILEANECSGSGCVVTLAQYEETPRGYRGAGQNFGRGWENDRRGRVTGTGSNFGGGFEVDRKRRSITGTGTRFGGGYDIGRGGRSVVGTGNNFGKGWERQGHEWVGTGGNFGKRCPARPGSSFVPCM